MEDGIHQPCMVHMTFLDSMCIQNRRVSNSLEASGLARGGQVGASAPGANGRGAKMKIIVIY